MSRRMVATTVRRRMIRASPASVATMTAFALVLAAPMIACAHAVAYPKVSAPGAYERYSLRVPHEKAIATTRIEIRFPQEVRVTSFEEVAGWQLEVVTDSAKKIVGAIWTGTLPPQRFVELPFVAVNPKSGGQLSWPAFQTYANGERVEWTGPKGSKHPASITMVGADASAASGTGARAGWPGSHWPWRSRVWGWRCVQGKGAASEMGRCSLLATRPARPRLGERLAQ
jgi:hypothetical protein